jgi:hypothetical protein
MKIYINKLNKQIKKMKEKETSKKKYYKPRKKREIIDSPIQELDIKDTANNILKGTINILEKQKLNGHYKVGKNFNIFFEKKPCGIHRFFSKLLLGWTWQNQKH